MLSTRPPSGPDFSASLLPALSVWPVIPDRLDTSQHAILHPSQPGLFLAFLLSLCSTLRHNTGWLEGSGGLVKRTEQCQAVLSLSLARIHSSYSLGGLEKCCSALHFNPPAGEAEIITI